MFKKYICALVASKHHFYVTEYYSVEILRNDLKHHNFLENEFVTAN